MAEGDALITRAEGVIVGVRTADCVPILLADPQTRAVGAVHAGWRGTASGIVQTAVRDMAQQFGSSPNDIIAAIGPSIGGCCYQVGTDVARRFETWLPEMGQSAEPSLLDLRLVNQLQLRALGVTAIWVSDECTFCNICYSSYRREGAAAGRMLAFVGSRKL